MELRRGSVCPGAAERGEVFGETLEKERGDRDNKKTPPVNAPSTDILDNTSWLKTHQTLKNPGKLLQQLPSYN